MNTLEKGRRDLKIAAARRRPAGEEATPRERRSRRSPAASARVTRADAATSKRFRRDRKARLKRLGLKAMAGLHVSGDGASWIWKSARGTLTGSHRILDIYHACEPVADAAKASHGEGTPAAAAFFERGRSPPLEEGWVGIRRPIGEGCARGDTPARRAALEKLTGRSVSHRMRLPYPGNLAAGKAIGSGAVEGAAKTLGLRLQARGGPRKAKDARAMAATVCARNGQEWSSFWNNAA